MTAKDVVDVSENDVLLGRGKRSNNWPGNIRFRQLVDAQQNAYMTANDDLTRDAIAYEIANSIERQGGRFLRETVVEVSGVPRSGWMVVEGATIRTKVKQALRDSSKAKSREHTNSREEGYASGDRKPPAQAVNSSAVSGNIVVESNVTGGKRPRQEALLHHQQEFQDSSKRPAVAARASDATANRGMHERLGTGVSDQQHMAASLQNPASWMLPGEQLPLHCGSTPDRQLHAALAREQQLSLLRALASEQQQHVRLETERRSIAAALQLRRVAGFLPSHLDSFPFRNNPIASPQPAYLDHLRMLNQPSPTDTLAALRFRQTLDAEQSLFGGQLGASTLLDHQLQQALLLRSQQQQLIAQSLISTRRDAQQVFGAVPEIPNRLDPISNDNDLESDQSESSTSNDSVQTHPTAGKDPDD